MRQEAHPGVPSFPRFRWLAASSFFFGVPLFLVFLWISQVLSGWEADSWEDLERKMSIMRLELEGSRTSASFLNDSLLRLQAEVFGDLNPRGFFSDLKKWLQKEFPGTFEFLLIDDRGNTVTDLSDIIPPAKTVRAFFRDCRQFQDMNRTPLEANFKDYQPFLGPAFCHYPKVPLINHFFSASYSEKRSYLFVSWPTEKGMFLSWISQTKDWNRLGPGIHLKAMRKRYPELRAGFVTMSSSRPGDPATWGDLHPFLDRAFMHLQSEPGRFHRDRGFLWGCLPVDPSLSLLLALPNSAPADWRALRAAGGVICLVSFLLLGVWSFPLLTGGEEISGGMATGTGWPGKGKSPGVSRSIRWKFAFLFSYVVGIPLLIVGIGSHRFLQDRKRTLEKELFAKHERLVADFEQDFHAGVGTFQNEVLEALGKPFPGRDFSPEQCIARCREVTRRFSVDACEVIDEKRKSVFSTESGWADHVQKLRPILRSQIHAAFPDLKDPEGGSPDPREEILLKSTLDYLGLNADFMFANLTAYVKTIKSFKFANGRFEMLLFPFKDAGRRTRLAALFGWQDLSVRDFYLERSLPAFLARNRGISILVHLVGQKYDESFPYHREVSWIKDLVANQGKPVKMVFEGKDGIRMFMTGLKAQLLPHTYLFLVSSGREIMSALRVPLLVILVICLSLLFFGYAASVALSDRFLAPVMNLAEGVRAIDERRFSHRIPVLDLDEMGVLSETFNEMLAGLEDLEVAKVTQEQLFPRKPLDLGAWRIFGTCRPASHVGGDYFDYFPLDGGRILMLLGDVSGHGVPAALVVGMAKAMLNHPACSHQPGEFLDTCQEVFSRLLQKRMMMTCMIAVLDVESGTLRMANAGQTFPFLLRAGKAEQIGVSGFPLGTRNRKSYPEVEFRLVRGDVLVFHSDGFFEATDTNGASLGFPRCQEAVENLDLSTPEGNDPVEIERALRDWHSRVSPEDPPADDISLMILSGGGTLT